MISFVNLYNAYLLSRKEFFLFNPFQGLSSQVYGIIANPGFHPGLISCKPPACLRAEIVSLLTSAATEKGQLRRLPACSLPPKALSLGDQDANR